MAVVNGDFMDESRSLSLPLGGSTEWKRHGGTKADRDFSSQNLRDLPRPRRQHLGGEFARLCGRSWRLLRHSQGLQSGSSQDGVRDAMKLRAPPAAGRPGARDSGSRAALVLVFTRTVSPTAVIVSAAQLLSSHSKCHFQTAHNKASNENSKEKKGEKKPTAGVKGGEKSVNIGPLSAGSTLEAVWVEQDSHILCDSPVLSWGSLKFHRIEGKFASTKFPFTFFFPGSSSRRETSVIGKLVLMFEVSIDCWGSNYHM